MGLFDSVTGAISKAVGQVTDTVTNAVEDVTGLNVHQGKSGTDFETELQNQITPGADGKVSEEALFAGIMPARIKALKNEEVAQKFSDAMAANKETMKKGDGYVPLEDAAKAALSTLVAAGDLTQEEGDKIYAQAFAAAQLDANTSALYDDRGGANDFTIATETLEKALLSARVKMEEFDEGTTTAETRALTEASNGKTGAVGGLAGTITTSSMSAGGVIQPQGTTVDGQNGFLFKPVTENEGTLAVLTPEAIAALTESVLLKDAFGNVVEEGRFTSMGDEGTRAKYAFSQPGGNYPQNLTVQFKLTDGTVREYAIADPSQRYD